jgi:hypothetical protein
MCAPGDQRKSRDNKREQGELNVLECQRRRFFKLMPNRERRVPAASKQKPRLIRLLVSRLLAPLSCARVG